MDLWGMIELSPMRKAIKGLLIALAVTVVIVLSVLPVLLPPVVESIVRAKISEFGLKSSVKMSLGYCWRNGPGIGGGLTVALADSPWRATAEFGASCCEWSASVKMDKTAFSEDDTVIKTLLEKYPVTAVSNLTFSGSIALDAKIERTFHMPVPVWSAKLPLRNLSAGFVIEEKPFAINGFSVTAGASGIANHLDITPIYPRAKSISADGFVLTNFSASVRMTEKSLLVTQASAGLCGGKVNVYSLTLNPETLNAGFTLFVDDVETGELLSHLNGFNGEASGRLHGKVRLFVRKGGKAVRLSDAFLYSTPGETGKLKLNDPTPVTDNLALAGLDETTRNNVANALTDLDYSVLRLNLKPNRDKTATLSTTVRGTATRGRTSVPVDITLNFNGELEQLINTGLGYSNLLKGKQK